MKILHLSDIHLSSGSSHGKTNPETGLNTRFEDFLHSLSLCMDRAISEAVDLVLFGGDAFPDSTPAPFIQSAFAKEFRRLADIPTVLLVGNHDQHSHGVGGASLSIYHSLGVPNIIVGEKLATHTINTKSGKIQVITLPWLTRSTLMTREKTAKMTMEQINQLLIQKVKVALENEIRHLNPDIPTILVGHLMAERAQLGAERYLAVGKGFQIPLSLLIRPEFNYVALGHVHKHQNLNPSNNPPVVYAGSIERVDFSEEKEEKGYVLIDIEGNGGGRWEFCPLPARPFCTIEVNVTKSENPLQDILQAIAKHSIESAVVRLIYQAHSTQLNDIDQKIIHEALESAHKYTIRPTVVKEESRRRLPELGEGSNLDPYSALSIYLKTKEEVKDIAEEMLTTAKELLANI